jgi:hypothetical protein
MLFNVSAGLLHNQLLKPKIILPLFICPRQKLRSSICFSYGAILILLFNPRAKARGYKHKTPTGFNAYSPLLLLVA